MEDEQGTLVNWGQVNSRGSTSLTTRGGCDVVGITGTQTGNDWKMYRERLLIGVAVAYMYVHISVLCNTSLLFGQLINHAK